MTIGAANRDPEIAINPRNYICPRRYVPIRVRPGLIRCRVVRYAGSAARYPGRGYRRKAGAVRDYYPGVSVSVISARSEVDELVFLG